MSAAIKTACPYCGVGCGVLERRDPGGKVVVAGDPAHPANLGRLCSKGAALAETMSHDGRALYPQVNGARVEWPDAIKAVADGFARTIAQHGPDSVAFYVSGQLLTEDYYVANKPLHNNTSVPGFSGKCKSAIWQLMLRRGSITTI